MAANAKPKHDNIPVSLLYHHTRQYCEEVRDCSCRLTVLDTDGKPLAVLVPVEDAKLLERLGSRESSGVAVAEIDAETA